MRDYLPLPGHDQDDALVCAAAQAGEERRGVAGIHDLRYRPPRWRTAKMLVLILAHNEEASIGKNLRALLPQTRIPGRA